MKFRYLILVLLLSLTVFGQASDDALSLGNPSQAVTDLNQPDNYLVIHNGYALSYNKSRGTANWVAWRLEKSNIGKAERTNAFAPDTILPRDWWVLPSDYTDSGYDRGHMMPSKDRSDSEEANRVSFLMSNMQPQSPKLNQKTWKYLEDYTREIVAKGNEAYIYAGCYGNQGRLKDKVMVPASCFKIIILLTIGDDDLKRINNTTRIIAVDMPNDDLVSIRWRSYITTVDDIEQKTGYDFLSNVPKDIQKEIEARKDDQTDEQPTAKNDQSLPPPAGRKASSDGREYLTVTHGGCYYLTASGNKKYVDKSFCENVSVNAAEESASKSQTTNQIQNQLPQISTPVPDKSNADSRKYYMGARGGCYYLTASGAKKYVDNIYCTEAPANTNESATKPETPAAREPEKKPAEKSAEKSNDRTYFKGSRGGCYYLTGSGKKVYVNKENCGN